MSSKRDSVKTEKTSETGKSKLYFLNRLKEVDANPMQMLLSCPNADTEYIKDLFVQKSAEAQKLVVEENHSEYFKDADNLVQDLLRDSEDKPKNVQDIALLLKTIAVTEEHPDPEEIGGIDLKSLYTTLSLMAMGYPVEELNEPTHMFLAECLDNLRADSKSKKPQDSQVVENSQPDNPAHFTITLLD